MLKEQQILGPFNCLTFKWHWWTWLPILAPVNHVCISVPKCFTVWQVSAERFFFWLVK